MGRRQRPLRLLTSLLPVLRTSCPRASGTRRRARGEGYEGRDGVAESEGDRMMREPGDVVKKFLDLIGRTYLQYPYVGSTRMHTDTRKKS